MDGVYIVPITLSVDTSGNIVIKASQASDSPATSDSQPLHYVQTTETISESEPAKTPNQNPQSGPSVIVSQKQLNRWKRGIHQCMRPAPFPLAPTPAQLGRAPLQKRLSRGMFWIHQLVRTGSNEATIPRSESGPTTPLDVGEVGAHSPKKENLPSPSLKKSLFKKGNEDGRDKVLETVNFSEKFNTLPQFKPEACSPSAMAVPRSPQLYLRKKHHKNQYGAMFGGFRGNVSANAVFSSRRGWSSAGVGTEAASGDEVIFTITAHAAHADIFPSKGSLQLKIREVRSEVDGPNPTSQPHSDLNTPTSLDVNSPIVSSLLPTSTASFRRFGYHYDHLSATIETKN
ncbi:unnamed protein product [Danaus chrysippus]|uniref:(African queen) hypothetical protein n=1 Tax=Danaus chrysippus TaxID=151541 RepID=A0A8J2QSD4_9NEOP|nr:unnamed protein product [Danaus chrysippus]